MYPDVDKSPVSEDVIKRCGAVFDVIYNPNVTKLMETARRHSIKTVGGLAMLVWQAAAAHEIWEGSVFSGSDILEIIKDMEKLISGLN
jgi:shikimate dehydrogenase